MLHNKKIKYLKELSITPWTESGRVPTRKKKHFKKHVVLLIHTKVASGLSCC